MELNGWAALMVAHHEWEQRTVSHLLKPCDLPEPCELHQEWEAHNRTSAKRPRLSAAERRQIVSDRLQRNRDALAIAAGKLAAFYRSNTATADPAIVNLSLRSRPGALTDAKVRRWGQLSARVEDLRGRVARDEERLRRLAA